MDRAITAFPETLAWLGEAVSALEIDVAALQRPLRRCDLAVCAGTCCHDGVYLGPEEAGAVRRIVEESRVELEGMGLGLPEQVVVYGSWQDAVSGPKTAVRHQPKHGVVEDYPAHFPETACVFLLADARCALQALATRRGLPPWYYKPVTCWMHPLSIEGIDEDRPVLTLHDEENDPQRFPGYDGFVCRTPCGATCAGGEPAWKVLAQELEYLGSLGGRNLAEEIAAPQFLSGPRQELRGKESD